MSVNERGKPVSANQPDYDEQIRVLQESLEDVQKPETLKHRTGRNLLAHAELMFDVLDSIKDVHAFVGVATLPFRATLKIILVKQDNDKRIAALVVEMIDMMSALLELRDVKDTRREITTGESIESNVTRVLTGIKNDIQEAGNLVDGYAKARTWHRVLRVRDWAERFKEMAETFQRGKSNIQVALGVHTALTVDALHPKIDHVIRLMQEWFERPQSADERRFLDRVQQDGAQKYIDSETAFVNLYKDTGSGEKARESNINAPPDRDDSRDRAREAREVWEEIQGGPTKILAENHSIFEAKLEVQKRDLTTVIRQSEATIIRAINEGPYSYIAHPDIQILWKAMNWRLSVKTRHFVMALHDHYLHGTYAASHGGTAHDTGNTASSPVDGSESALSVNPADKWCLQYLRIRYLPAISEAFDDDGSGFIRISEVNEFTEGIPEGWSLLKWVAYWTGGWPTELGRYSHLIQEVMAQLAEAQCKVKPENLEYVTGYMNGFALSETRLMITSVQPGAATPGKSELHRLAAERRSQVENSLRTNLETVKYTIDGPDTLSLLCGPGRIEKYLFPLLYLLLARHLEIVRFASEHALDSKEMYQASQSLYNVMERVFHRVEELKESFRQQKLNVNDNFKNFACGIYSRYQYSDPSKGIGLKPQHPTPDNEGDGSLDEYVESEPEADKPSVDDAAVLPPSDPISPIPDKTVPANPDGLIPEEDGRETLVVSTAGLSAPIQSLSAAEDSPLQATVLPDEAPLPTSDAGFATVGKIDSSNKAVQFDPTRFGAFHLETSLYAQPSALTEDSVPWRPLRVQYSDIGPRQMFKMVCQRVLERVQLLSPRLTWAYLERRRSIRLRWIEVTLRDSQQFIGANQYKDWEPSDQDELDDLKSQLMPADVPYFDSLAHLQGRLRALHAGWHCDGCKSEIFGTRFGCLDCPGLGGLDLCDECEHAEIPRHDVVQHPSSHTMLQYNYPVMDGYHCGAFESRAQKYMLKHSKKPCPCSDNGSAAQSRDRTNILRCAGCQKEIWKEVHFRCLQCPDYDLCGDCEKDHPPQHCKAHVLLKLKAPFLERKTDGSDTKDEEEQPLSVEDRLVRLTQRLNDMETKFGSRLDEMQKGFARLASLLEHTG